MSKPKHTPGPWNVSFHKGAGNVFRLNNKMSANELMTAKDSNLTLIEAAPDLLEALDFARQIIWDFSDMIDEMPLYEGFDSPSMIFDYLGKISAKAKGE